MQIVRIRAPPNMAVGANQSTGQLTHNSRFGVGKPRVAVRQRVWGTGLPDCIFTFFRWGQHFQFNGPDHLTPVRFLSTNRIQDHVQWTPNDSWIMIANSNGSMWTTRGFFAPSCTIISIAIANELFNGSRWNENISLLEISRFRYFFCKQFLFKCCVNCCRIESFSKVLTGRLNPNWSEKSLRI